MKRALLISSLMVIIISTLIIAFFILPKGKSEILLDYHRKDYSSSLEKFEALYSEGDHSLSVINPLIDLYLDKAEPEKAIQLLQEFNQEHPNRPDVLKSLSSLYLGSDKPNSNLLIQEELVALKPSKNLLEFLVAHYLYKGEMEKWEKYLVALTKNYRAEPDAYEHLALYYASKNDFGSALSALDGAFAVCQDFNDCSLAATLKVSILIDQGHVDDALAFVLNALNKKGGLTQYPDYIQLFLNNDHAEAALAILDAIPLQERGHRDFIEAKINTFAQIGEKAKLLQYLRELNQAKLLTENQREVLISLSLTEESDPAEVLALLKENTLKKLPEDLWFSLIDYAIEAENRDLITRLENEIPETLMIRSPVLVYALNLAASLPPDPDHLAFYLRPDLEPLTSEETARLAILYHQVGFTALSTEELKNLSHFNTISIDLVPQLSTLYWPKPLREEGYKRIHSLYQQLDQPSAGLSSAWIALSILTARDRQVASWLALDPDHLNQSDWVLIFQACEEIENRQLALQIAETLKSKFQNDLSDLIYAKALILNDQFDKGLAILKSLQEKNARLKGLTADLLYGYAKAHEMDSFREEISQAFLHQALHDQEWLALGYLLEEKGLHEAASEVFVNLVEEKGPIGAPIEMVLFIWGEHFTPEQASWLIDHGAQTKGKEKGLILTALDNAGYPEAVLQMISQEEWSDPEIFKSYLLAASILKKSDLVYEAIQISLEKHPSIKTIQGWAKLLEGRGAENGLEILYLAILERIPEDKDALRNLGNLYFDKGSFQLSACYLGQYLTLYPPDSLSLFHFGELFQRDGDYFHARPFYRAAIGIPSEASANQLQITAISYYRLNYPFTAIHLMESGMDGYPQSASDLAFSLSALLLELDCLDYAVPYLFCENMQPSDNFNIENLRTSYFLKANERNNAFLQSNYVLDRYPDQPHGWASRGQLEYETGRFRESLDYYEYASSLKPEDEGFTQSIHEITNQHRSFTGLGWEYKKTGLTQIEHISRLKQAYNPVPYSRLLFLGELDSFHIRSYTNDQTGLVDQQSGYRSRFTLGWIHDFYQGLQSNQELYTASHIFGGGSHFTYFDHYGSTEAAVELRRPNWDFPETIVEYGSRDRVYLQRTQKLFERVDALLKVEGRRYHLQHAGSKAAESIAWLFDLAYTLPKCHWMIQMMGHDSNAAFNYNIDAELGTWIKRKYNAEGVLFYPLAVGKREIHTMEMQWSKIQYRYCHFFAHFGFSYDRFGGVNKALAVYGASLLWDKRPGLTFEMLYDHSPSPSVTGANQDRLILNWIYYY